MARSDRLAAIVVFAAMAACSQTPEPASGDLRDPDVRATLRTTVLPHASLAGVLSPATMVGVAAADHQAAEDVVSGAIINDHSPVYVVQMTGGSFVVPHHPRGVAAPQGNVMTVTVDAASYRVTDIGYDAVAPDLSRIDADVVDLLAP